MPHQCLQCGFAFQEGSSALLQGCPDCKGTRFFYTSRPVDASEREEIASRAQKDLRQVVTDMLQEAAPEVADEIRERTDGDGWARLRPRELRRLVQQVKANQAEASEFDLPSGEVEAAQQRLQEQKEALADREEKPDTISIREPGDYDIDLQGLLEKNPLVVHRDGAYVIHLPSLFDGPSQR